ncbi:uncharacterized protein ACN2A1_003021 [Glossina fuscipes fuscipes]
MNNNFPHTSKFPVNEQITQGNHRHNISGYSKSLVLRETNVALGLQKASGERPELGVGKNTVGVNEIFIENEWEEVKSKVSRDEVSKVNNPESSLVSASFQTANGKNVLISEKGKKRMEALLNEFHQSNDDFEDSLLSIKNKVISKKQKMMPKKKILKTSLTSRKEKGERDYSSCSSKLSATEKKSNIKVENNEGSEEMGK